MPSEYLGEWKLIVIQLTPLAIFRIGISTQTPETGMAKLTKIINNNDEFYIVW